MQLLLMAETKGQGPTGNENAMTYENNIRFELGVNANNLPTAKLFIKARNSQGEKLTAFYRFPTEQARQNWVDIQTKNAADRLATTASTKASRDEARANFVNPHKVGDILVESWGYDQTNIDFYQVTAVTPKGIKFREVCQASESREGFSPMSEHVTAVKGSFRANAKEEFRAFSLHVGADKTVTPWVSFNGHYLKPWDGKPEYASHYA